MSKKYDWELLYRRHGVRNVQQLISKAGGSQALSRLVGIPLTTIQSKLLYELKDLEGRPQRIFYFTDTHVQPKLETDHLEWIGKHIKETNPDHIIHGGDFADAESLCAHIMPHTKTAREKPSLKSEITCMEDAMLKINHFAGRSDIFVTLGNHEERIWTMEENNPDLAYLLQDRFDEAYEKAGWRYSKFGVYHPVCGVDFTHAPMMMAGRPVGGKLATNNVATNSIADCVFGHTHMFSSFTVKKFGPDRQVTAVNGGCSMPIGYIPDYTKKGANGWSHGIIDMVVHNGKIKDTSFTTLETLKRRYA